MLSVQSHKLAYKMTDKLCYYVLNKFVVFYLLINIVFLALVIPSLCYVCAYVDTCVANFTVFLFWQTGLQITKMPSCTLLLKPEVIL